MKSVHYANAFKNETLKNIAFILDNIEEILCYNKFSSHDDNVKFFNKKITEKDFKFSPENLVIVAIESFLTE